MEEDSSADTSILAVTDVAKSLAFDEDSADAEPQAGEPIKVILRVRALTTDERERGEQVAVRLDAERCRAHVRPRNPRLHKGAVRDADEAAFGFSRVYDEHSSTEQLYEDNARPLVRNLFDGKHGLVFAYGTTNAGKTYTILGGGDARQPGILQRCVAAILAPVAPTDVELEHELHMSCLEIYNEQCFDLLEAEVRAPPRRRRRVLRIKENVSGEVYVEGLQNVQLRRPGDVDAVLERVRLQRHVASTAHNERSSRSHAIFTLQLRQLRPHAEGVSELVRAASLAIVDLAGSERASSTSVACDRERLREAAQINKSLMNLARCLEVLRDVQRRGRRTAQNAPPPPPQSGGDGAPPRAAPSAKKLVVPYRQSRLTRLFRTSLERGSAVMIANISPTLRDADDTIHALSCAALACQVHVGVRPPPASYSTPLSAVTDVYSAAASPLRPSNRRHEQAAARGAALSPWSLLRWTEPTPPMAAMQAELARKSRAVALLEDEVRRLQEALSEAESRARVVEAEVREEVAAEMEDALAAMEEDYIERVDELRRSGEQRWERRMELVTNTARKEIAKRVANSATDAAVLSSLQEQLDAVRESRRYAQQQHDAERAQLMHRIERLERDLRAAGR